MLLRERKRKQMSQDLFKWRTLIDKTNLENNNIPRGGEISWFLSNVKSISEKT